MEQRAAQFMILYQGFLCTLWVGTERKSYSLQDTFLFRHTSAGLGLIQHLTVAVVRRVPRCIMPQSASLPSPGTYGNQPNICKRFGFKEWRPTRTQGPKFEL
ncbi:hypothetical protein AVEN_185677-1 [Araneus ventricosus]|uniref:Uncharacterized protein n=1 Tax=Araneus ventricosus TaxID=182803 RepID=A0A4Y2JHI6_ARAVE|nr:hypothetical protein AVEN_185677-1 [Araneus ventricosus]